MTNPPQNVSERYISNLLRTGANSDFILHYITKRESRVDNLVVGTYYDASIYHGGDNQAAAGATPSQAVRRAMEKFGVTFK
jgi:hypothetical protein